MVEQAREVTTAHLSLVVVAQVGVQLADDSRRRGELIGPRDGAQVVVDNRGAVAERARRVGVEQQEADDEAGLEARAVYPPVVLQRRQAPQQGPPLRVVEGGVTARFGRQQGRQL